LSVEMLADVWVWVSQQIVSAWGAHDFA